MDYFNNCNFSKHQQCAPWWRCDCTETCRSCFNVNFNIVFKTVHLYISWWIEQLWWYQDARYVCENKKKLYIYVLYIFVWVIPRRLNFICRRLGTLCLFHLHRHVGVEWGEEFSNLVIIHLLAYEDGTDRVFQNVGI